MINLPNPFVSGATDCPPEKAVASLRQSYDAAADIAEPNTDCIGEIFVGARKLDQPPVRFDPAAINGRDELLYVTLKLMDKPGTPDLPEIPSALWDEFDEPPLFLRQAI